MSGMPWVKLYTEMLDDIKLIGLTDSQKWRFVQLLMFAGECDAGGAFVTGESRVTHEEIAWRLRISVTELEKDIEVLTKIGILAIENDVLIIKNFLQRQGPTQAEKREQWQTRQKKKRDKAKTEGEDENVTRDSRVSHALEEEEEEEEDGEEAATTPPQLSPFVQMSAKMSNKLHMNETQTLTGQKKWNDAINELLNIPGLMDCDIDSAMAYMDSNKMTITGPWSLVGPVRIAASKRQRENVTLGTARRKGQKI